MTILHIPHATYRDGEQLIDNILREFHIRTWNVSFLYVNVCVLWLVNAECIHYCFL